MEKQGAVVTCFESSDEVSIDILPSYLEDLAAQKNAGSSVVKRVRDAWQFTKGELNLSATAHFGNIYLDPILLGKFDIAFLGAIFLHCKSPFDVMHQACTLATETVIVTDLVSAGVETETDSLMRFNPTKGSSVIYWWSISPGAIVNMLQLHGFTNCTVTFHEQATYNLANLAVGPTYAKMYTVVGTRP